MGNSSDFLRSADFYAILDTSYVERKNLAQKCAQILDANVKILQLRAKNETRAELREIALEILPLFKNRQTRFVINDDVELAAEIGAGLHIGQDDANPYEARQAIGRDAILGLSTHSAKQARDANAMGDVLDYFAVGPVFATQTKPGRPAVGIELVREVALNLQASLPWFAIGGVNSKTAKEVRRAGAERIVAVSDVLLESNTTSAILNLRNLFLEI